LKRSSPVPRVATIPASWGQPDCSMAQSTGWSRARSWWESASVPSLRMAGHWRRNPQAPRDAMVLPNRKRRVHRTKTSAMPLGPARKPSESTACPIPTKAAHPELGPAVPQLWLVLPSWKPMICPTWATLLLNPQGWATVPNPTRPGRHPLPNAVGSTQSPAHPAWQTRPRTARIAATARPALRAQPAPTARPAPRPRPARPTVAVGPNPTAARRWAAARNLRVRTAARHRPGVGRSSVLL